MRERRGERIPSNEFTGANGDACHMLPRKVGTPWWDAANQWLAGIDRE